MPQLSSTRVAGYRSSPKGRNDAQLFAQSRTLRIRQTVGLDLSIARSTSPLQPVAMLPLRDFHKVSRAAGPKMTNRKLNYGELGGREVGFCEVETADFGRIMSHSSGGFVTGS